MQRLLIIEDEERLRLAMVRALSKLQGVEVISAGTLTEALARIEEARPDAILSDLDLPDRFGGELLGELERRGLRVPVTYVSAYSRKFAGRVPRARDVRIVDKPVSVERLRELAAVALSAGDSVLPPPFGAADYLQLACIGRHSVVITRRLEADDEVAVGRIVVWGGELWDASDEEGAGEAAFRRIVSLQGVFRAHTLDREPGQRTVFGAWEMLVLDALREADEAAAGALQVAEQQSDRRAERQAEQQTEHDLDEALAVLAQYADAPSEREVTPRADPYLDAFERGVEAWLARDLEGAARAFERALEARPEDAKARANLERLRALGAVDPGHGSAAGEKT